MLERKGACCFDGNRFLEPVDAGALTDTPTEMEAAYALIRNRIEEGLEYLLLEQEKDPHRDFLPRLWNLGTSFFPGFSSTSENDHP